MSMWANIACADCGMRGPDFGQGGFLGYPSLAVDKGPAGDSGGPELVNLGFLLPAYAALGLASVGLDRLCAFLKEHDGHGMFILSEGHDAESEDLPPALTAMLEAEEADDEEEEDKRLDAWRETWEPPFGDEYAEARYELACAGCQTSLQTVGGASWLRTTNKSISEEEASLVLQRLFQVEPYNFYRADPILNPHEGLQPLRAYLDYHKGHDLKARTVPI